MTKKNWQDSNWLKSGEIRKKLKLSTCELAHLREAGKLLYRKKGDAYLCLHEDGAIRAIQEKH